MRHFSHFRFSEKEKQPAFIKTKKQYVAFYVPAHYYFPERILQPLTKIKRAHKQDSSLWVISLIMPLYVGCHFVFFPFAPKQIHAALRFWNTTSITAQCGPSKLILQMWKKWICRRRRARFSSFWFPPSPTDSFVTYFDEKNGTPQLLWPPAVFRRRLRWRAKYKDRGSCRSWATSLNLPSLFGCKRILRSLPYNDSQHSFLLVKP